MGQPMIILRTGILTVAGNHHIRAHMLVKIQPAAVLVDKVRAVTLPETGDPAEAIVGDGAGDQAGGQEIGPGGFAVVGHLHHVRCQGVDGELHERQHIKARDLRHGLIVLLELLGGLNVIEHDQAVPHGFEAPHPAKAVGPANIITVRPELRKLLPVPCPTMEIGMGGVEKFRLQRGGAVPDSLL